MLTTLLLLAAPASAWEHTGFVWADDQFPLVWYMDDDPEDSLPGYDLQGLIQLSWDGWDAAVCAPIEEEFGEVGDYGSAENDGRIAFYWDDPGDEMDAGVLGVTYSYPSSRQQVVGGESYTVFADADITMNDDVAWATPEDFENGTCLGDMTDAEGVLTHEIGHLLGLDHTCEEGELCQTADLTEATMYWSVGPCDHKQSDINQEDIESLTSLYGPYGQFTATADSQRYGATPLEVSFELTSDQTIIDALWNFGDGNTSTEINPTHTYTTSGQFSVAVSMNLDGGECGIYNSVATELAYIVACTAPTPEEGANGFFTMSHFDGLTYRTENRTDVSVYGCVDTIEWQVYEGSSAADITGEPVQRIGAWSPKITFPSAGSYVVVMNVGGPGGIDAGYLVVNAEDIQGEGGGCSTVPGPAVPGSTVPLAATFGTLLVAGFAGLRRRRA